MFATKDLVKLLSLRVKQILRGTKKRNTVNKSEPAMPKNQKMGKVVNKGFGDQNEVPDN